MYACARLVAVCSAYSVCSVAELYMYTAALALLAASAAHPNIYMMLLTFIGCKPPKVIKKEG